LPFGFFGLPLIGQARLQQLIAQGHAHDKSLGVTRTCTLTLPLMKCLPAYRRNDEDRIADGGLLHSDIKENGRAV
jgi:hypothetical protein